MAFRFRLWSARQAPPAVQTGDSDARGTTETRRDNIGRVTGGGLYHGRSYGYRSTAVQPPAGDDAGVAPLPPVRGSQSNEISNPGSRGVIDGQSFAPGRSYMGRTEDTLNTGHSPQRIRRNTTARNAGSIGSAGFPAGGVGWPYDGNALFIPHQIIPRRPITVTPFQRTIDNGVSIVSSPIGGPVS